MKKILKKNKIKNSIPKLSLLNRLSLTGLLLIYIVIVVTIIFAGFNLITKLILILLLITTLLTGTYFLKKFFYKKQNFNYTGRIFFKEKLFDILKTIFVTPIIITLLFFILITFFPAKSSYYILENQETGKEVVLRGMSHIGSIHFYDKIGKEIEYFTNENFIYYFEGVSLENIENKDLFKETIGVDGDPNTYLEILGFRNIIHQDQKLLNSFAKNNNLKNVDVSIESMIKEKERLGIENSPIVEQANEVGFSRLSILKNNGDNVLLNNFIVQNVLNIYKEGFITIGNHLSLYVLEKGMLGEFYSKILLDFRNKNFVEYFINSNDQKVYMNYGELHIKGIKELLEEKGFKEKSFKGENNFKGIYNNMNLKFYR